MSAIAYSTVLLSAASASAAAPLPRPPQPIRPSLSVSLLAANDVSGKKLPLLRRMEERAGERRKLFRGCPSPRSSPHSCVAGRGRSSALQKIGAVIDTSASGCRFRAEAAGSSGDYRRGVDKTAVLP